MRVLVLSGPNLQLLGRRQPDVYGDQTLDDVHAQLLDEAQVLGVEVICRQSNHEGDLCTWVGDAERDGFAGVVLNPGAYGHTSIALYDAVRALRIPVVEVHISNPDAREPFRRRAMVARACMARIAGFGVASYIWGLRALVGHLKAPTRPLVATGQSG